MKFVLQQQQ